MRPLALALWMSDTHRHTLKTWYPDLRDVDSVPDYATWCAVQMDVGKKTTTNLTLLIARFWTAYV